jgi:hypothetical protein
MSISFDETEIEKQYRAGCPGDFMLFVKGLIIPSQDGPRLFSTCMSDHQRECFEDLAPSLHNVRDGEMPLIRRAWIERTKKAAKDSDLAAMILWLLAFPIRPTYFQAGAADKDQAAIVRRRMADLLYYNSWLNDLVEIQNYKVVSKKQELAELDILAATIPGSHGGTPDLLICNELSHVEKWEFIENLLDNADGVARGMVIVATNAGFKGTKADTLRKGSWKKYIWDRPAPWTNPDALKEAKERNSKSRYNRLWWGKWASGKGDALDEEAVDRCFKSDLKPLKEPEEGWFYIAGLDLGVSHDHSGFVVAGVNIAEEKIRVAKIHCWKPLLETGEVDLTEVERGVFKAYQDFHLAWVGYDPTEARLMAQRLTKLDVPMREYTFASPKHLTVMASSLLQVVESGTLESFESEELRRDFGKFDVVEKAYGYKLEAVSDEFGHADVGTALVILLPKAVETLSFGLGLRPGDVLFEEDDSPLTEEEMKGIHPEMREMLEMDDGQDDEEWNW